MADLSKTTTPSITTMQELQELEKETEKRVREIEKKIHSNESMYIQNTTLQNPQTSSMFGGFGNLMSGWEGLLEARSVDKKRATERIFSSSSESWLAHRRELDQKKKQENGGGGGGGGGGGDEVQTTINGNKTNQYTADISTGVAEPPAPSVVSAAELAKIAELKALKKQKKLEKKAKRALEQEAKNSHQGQGTTVTGDLQINSFVADGGSGGTARGGEKSEDDNGGGVERQGGQKRPREDDIFTDTNMDGTISNDMSASAANAFDGLPSPSALMGPPMKKTIKSSKKG